MKKELLAAGVVISSCMFSVEVKAASFTGLNVFGDSLVDSGNLFNLTEALLSPLGLPALPPSPPYDQRNSNGPIWIDNVGQALGLSPTLATEFIVNPATIPPPTQGINFAFAGALSSDVYILDDDLPFLSDFFLGFQDQIDLFTALSATLPLDPNALNVVWVGANDYNEAFLSPASLGGVSLNELPNVVTDNIIDGLTQLSSVGVKEFLVPNLPDIGESPFADFLDNLFQQDISTQLNQLTFAHNELLSAKLTVFGQSQPDTTIVSLDINSLFADILASPGEFGLTNTTESCLINFQPGFLFDGVCDQPDEFFFWDDTHPTTAAYEIISDFALAALDDDAPTTSVPESSSVAALLTVGLVGSGTVLTKRRARKKK
ncbi:MAG: SGNH/GDSL hydrolase family protein [Cyanobacteria bacterium J06627_3]